MKPSGIIGIMVLLVATVPVGADLEGNSSLIITGDGGKIHGGEFTTNQSENIYRPVISMNAGTLTIDCKSGGDGSQDECLTVHGYFDIEATLTNNAYVIADLRTVPGLEFGDLRVLGSGTNGSGYWIASSSTYGGTTIPGRLLVNVEVEGSGRWNLTEHADAEIVFNTDCLDLTGNFTIHKGLLLLNADVITTGNLEYRSLSGSLPCIKLAQGVVASFD